MLLPNRDPRKATDLQRLWICIYAVLISSAPKPLPFSPFAQSCTDQFQRLSACSNSLSKHQRRFTVLQDLQEDFSFAPARSIHGGSTKRSTCWSTDWSTNWFNKLTHRLISKLIQLIHRLIHSMVTVRSSRDSSTRQRTCTYNTLGTHNCLLSESCTPCTNGAPFSSDQEWPRMSFAQVFGSALGLRLWIQEQVAGRPGKSNIVSSKTNTCRVKSGRKSDLLIQLFGAFKTVKL